MALTKSQKNHFKNLQKRFLNIENSPRCTLACPMCKRTTFFKLNEEKVIPGMDMTLEDLEKCLKYFKRITFSGQLSDPIFNKDLIKMLQICYQNNIHTRVNTAATGRKTDWYMEAFLANPKATWTFGIDGPANLSHLYRKNQNSEHLFEMMLLARKMNVKTVWQYIIFSYNKAYLEQCKQIAKEHGIIMNLIYSQRDLPLEFIPRGENER